ncbi:aps8, partial [Metarhizium majus ARSEF 297]
MDSDGFPSKINRSVWLAGAVIIIVGRTFGLRLALPIPTVIFTEYKHNCERYGIKTGSQGVYVKLTATNWVELHSNSANAIKSTAYQAMVHSAPNSLTIRHKEDHAKRRRILSLAFSDSQILKYEKIVHRHIDSLCDNIKAAIDRQKEATEEISVDMSDQSDWLTFDIMSEVIFGMKYNALKESKWRYVPTAIQNSNIRVSALIQAYSLSTCRIDRYLFAASIKARNQYLRFIFGLLKNRSKASFSDSGNVFSFLETAKDTSDNDKPVLSRSEIQAECATLVVAGSDTSSSTLAATMYYLSSNPESYEKACREVRSTFQNLADIVLGPRLNSCVYLRACIDEALRLSPPAGSALWREIGQGGMLIDGQRIPQGIDVGVGIYSLHHNQAYHDNPFQYAPERWIVGEGSSTAESVERERSAFAPFSSGPRGCVGKGFAYREMTLTLARVIHQFDFALATEVPQVAGIHTIGGHDEFLLKDHVTGSKMGPFLTFKHRAHEDGIAV